MVKILGKLLVTGWSLVAMHCMATDFNSQPKQCFRCNSWNKPLKPFQVACNTYYVGTAGLSAILITSDAGHILIDGGLPQSAAMIDANIRELGFRTEDVRLILTSHAHFDHVGGIAALQKLTQAEVAASPASAEALMRGGPVKGDPQYAFGQWANSFPAINKVRIIDDNEELRVGALRVTAHFTPGHAPGSTSWSWQSCESGRCYDMVYADSLSPVSAPGFQFTDTSNLSVNVDVFEQSIQTIRELSCDVLLLPHPGFFDMQGKLQRRDQGETENPFINPDACQHYADNANKRLQERRANRGSGL